MLSLLIYYIVYDAGDARGGGLRCCQKLRPAAIQSTFQVPPTGQNPTMIVVEPWVKAGWRFMPMGGRN